MGSFPASELSLKQIRSYLMSALSRQYKKFDVVLTLAKMRQFPVYVSGFVNSPGSVQGTATSAVFDVLGPVGGVMKTGSLRTIVLYRADGKAGVSSREVRVRSRLGHRIDVTDCAGLDLRGA